MQEKHIWYLVKKIPWRRKWQPIPVFLPGKSHGHRSLAGYSPSGHKESDMTEWINICCPSVAQLCPILCHPRDCSTPGFPALHCLWDLAQTHAHAQSKLTPFVAIITEIVLLKMFFSEFITLELENNLESRLFQLLSLIIFEDSDFPNSKHIEFHFLNFVSFLIHFFLKYV